MILGILQARASSSRLPGKVLLPVLGRPMLARQIERLQRARRIDRLVVATSDRTEDDPIALLCEDIGVDCYRGNLNDVLDRFHGAAARYKPQAVVRLTGDCPLADPEVVDRLVDLFRAARCDYASNTLKPTWPDGIDAEICTMEALDAAWRDARLPSEREHVTPYLYGHPALFSLRSLENDVDRSGLRWTVDDAADLAFVRAIYDALYPADPAFDTEDILALLARNPELAEINSGRVRNEGYAKSLAAENKA